jgi:hypothetical protein
VLAKSQEEKTMNRKSFCFFTGLCGLMTFALCAISSGAQTSEVKEKPAMYSYVANWQIPRARWADMEKENTSNKAILDKAMADGTLVGYGSDEVLVHSSDGETHDEWWSSMSMAGLLKVLDQFAGSSNASTGVLASSTKHWDEVLESHYYNWHPGSIKGGYTRVAEYKLKADAPDDAVDTLSKSLIVPLMEKLLADGTLAEYEVDTLAVHTSPPGTFSIVYIATKAEGLDKVNAAIAEAIKGSPLSGPAFGSMTEGSAHRDELAKTDAIYK